MVVDPLIIIDAPHFYAAVVLRCDVVIRAAPILKYMMGWSSERVKQYARRKGWDIR
jgi:hypothetical protein